MVIEACPHCGSKNMDECFESDLLFHKKCRDCGWGGVAIEFESEKAYQIFYRDFKKQKNK
jgi:uncharacterized protein (DUF983 family)